MSSDDATVETNASTEDENNATIVSPDAPREDGEGGGSTPRDVISPPSRPRSLVLESLEGEDGKRPSGLAKGVDDLDTGSTDLPEHLVSPGSAASSSLYSPQHQTLKGEFSKEGDLVFFTADNLQEQIRRSSPLDRKGELSSFGRSRASSMQSLRSSAVSSCASSRSPSICGGGLPGCSVFFRCVLSSLYEGLSVRPSVRMSVRPLPLRKKRRNRPKSSGNESYSR